MNLSVFQATIVSETPHINELRAIFFAKALPVVLGFLQAASSLGKIASRQEEIARVNID
jgi:hypothetical protein